ncbi:MAG: cyclic lactone autoinducer peptide [Clostridiales bacterium]|nr:cyclic lactone autoinducer peptide [Clostridiales bacterium]
MFDKIMTKVCDVIAKNLTSVATMATNTVSLYGQYEHEMPKNLKK